MDEASKKLIKAIQDTIRDEVLVTKLCSKSKRWWTKEPMQLRKHANKLSRTSFRLQADPMHTVHMEHQIAAKKYS